MWKFRKFSATFLFFPWNRMLSIPYQKMIFFLISMHLWMIHCIRDFSTRNAWTETSKIIQISYQIFVKNCCQKFVIFRPLYFSVCSDLLRFLNWFEIFNPSSFTATKVIFAIICAFTTEIDDRKMFPKPQNLWHWSDLMKFIKNSLV